MPLPKVPKVFFKVLYSLSVSPPSSKVKARFYPLASNLLTSNIVRDWFELSKMLVALVPPEDSANYSCANCPDFLNSSLGTVTFREGY